jgi:hypothetical protein
MKTAAPPSRTALVAVATAGLTALETLRAAAREADASLQWCVVATPGWREMAERTYGPVDLRARALYAGWCVPPPLTRHTWRVSVAAPDVIF